MYKLKNNNWNIIKVFERGFKFSLPPLAKHSSAIKGSDTYLKDVKKVKFCFVSHN